MLRLFPIKPVHGLALAVLVFAGLGLPVQAEAILRITEVMSSSGTTGTPTPDWFELSNVGDATVDITGWKMDDNSYAFGSAVALNGITNIPAGESVVFFEDTTTNNVAAFKSFWGGMSGKQVGTYSGSGVGLSSSGDGVVVFDSTGNEINRVGFGAATTGTSFYWVYDTSGNLITGSTGTLSSSGQLGAYGSTTNATYTVANIASPGTRATTTALAFTSSGDKFAKTGSLYSYNVTYQKRLSTDPEPTLSALTKPTWLSLFNYTLSGTPATNHIGTNQTVALRLTTVLTNVVNGVTNRVTNTVDQTFALSVFAAQPQVVLNEYNGVSGGKFLSRGAADSRLGRIDGNGGNWIELVVVGNGTLGSTVDMRGWKIQISDVGTGPRLADTLTLSSNPFWQSVPVGMILTFTEDNTAAGGLDSSVTVEDHLNSAGWAWRNVWMGDTNLVSSISYANVASGISTIGKDDTQVVILNASNNIVFGPCGENVVKNPSVNSTSVFALQLDPSSGILPNLTTNTNDPVLANAFVGFEKSTFGRPNKLVGSGLQPFFGKQPPYFVALPDNLVKAGGPLSSFIDYRQDQEHDLIISIRSKGGSAAPSWVFITGASNYGATLEANPGLGDAGTYALEFRLVDTVTGAETLEDYNLVVLPASSSVLVNEYNCVSSSNQLNKGVVDAASGDGLDTYFGTVNGNGGGWLELVVVGDGTAGSKVDMRGWKIEIDDGAGSVFTPDDTIVLSNDAYWQNVPAGTILTFTDQTTAQGGLDTWINKKCLRKTAGYDWSNIFVFDPNYVDQLNSILGGGLGISSSNAQVRIRKADGTVVSGPIGEGIRPVSGVSNNQILEYVGEPSQTSSPLDTTVNSNNETVSAYGNGNGSTFGEPNKRLGGTAAQNFSAYVVANTAPILSNQPEKYAVEGASYTWTATTADAEGNSVTLAKVSGPSWLSVSGKTLSGTAPQGSAGFYDIELSANDGSITTPLKFRLTVFNDNPSMILNEYNAVDNSGTTLTYLDGGTQAIDSAGGTASDVHFGRVAGNGGDWVEFVVTGNGSAGTTDLRGYTIEIDEGASSGYFAAKVKIKLSQDPFWAAVPNGTILTFTESNTSQGGMDTNLSAANNSATSGWRWANVWIGDSSLITYTDLLTNGYSITTGVVSGINIDDTETQFRILNSSGYPVFGPCGEGIAPLNKISNTDVLELEGNPTASVLPTDRSDDTVAPPKNGYDNSTKDSTFGAPNQWHYGSGGDLTTQDFTPYKSSSSSSGTSFSSWASAAGQGSLSMTSDTDGNGYAALLDFVFGASTPGSLAPAYKPTSSVVTSGSTKKLVLAYYQRQGTTGVTVQPQTNTGLTGAWVAVPAEDIVAVGSPISLGSYTVQKYEASVLIDSTIKQRFIRLQATAQ